MSKACKFNVRGCTNLNDITTYSDILSTIFVIFSEGCEDFQPIFNSMRSGDIFYSDVNTQWGQYAYDYFNALELSSACFQYFNKDFYTPTFPVFHIENIVTIPDEYNYIVLCGDNPENGDIIFYNTPSTINNIKTLPNSAWNMKYIGGSYITSIQLPFSFNDSETRSWSTGAGFTNNGYYQLLQINMALPNKNNSRYVRITTDTVLSALNTYINNNPYTPPPTDPYAGGGDSTIGGGGGTFSDTSDPVPIPSLPTVGATDTGFISLFVPSLSQINSVASYLWSNFFDLDTFKKLFEDPMDCILGLSVVPVSVPTSGSAQLTVGNIELSGISLPLASNQYVEIDCGSISFTDRYFGSYLDFEPYTKFSIFLPYCGVHQLNADDIIGKTIQVVYHVDILTGSCVAFVKCGDSVLYQFNGACATNIPITNLSYNSTIENAIRIAVNIGTTVATAGASAPLTGAVEGASVGMQTAQNIGRGISLAGSTAEGALSMKPSIGRSGALGGTTGIMAGQTPYLIITRPRLCKPKNQDFFMGYPSFIQTTIGDLIGKGFTSFTEVIISSQYLTDDEESELENILKGGVYL